MEMRFLGAAIATWKAIKTSQMTNRLMANILRIVSGLALVWPGVTILGTLAANAKTGSSADLAYSYLVVIPAGGLW